MTQFISDFWNVLKLDRKIIFAIGDDRTGLWRSLRLFLVISLLITIGGLASSLSTEPKGVGNGLDTLETRLDQLLTYRLPSSVENFVTNLSENVKSSSTALEQYPPPLGKEVSYTIRSIGKWLSAPLSILGGWMSAALAVFLVAKIFKGQGELRNHVAVLLLGFTPHILLLVSSFTFLNSTLGWIGSILAVIAFIWSMAVIVAGIRGVHQLSIGSSLLVLIVTFLVFAFLLPALSIALAALVAVVVF
jgi:hypothetical protein